MNLVNKHSTPRLYSEAITSAYPPDPMTLNYRKSAIQYELDQFFETITGSPTFFDVSTAAFCEARSKLKPEAFVVLNEAILDLAAPIRVI